MRQTIIHNVPTVFSDPSSQSVGTLYFKHLTFSSLKAFRVALVNPVDYLFRNHLSGENNTTTTPENASSVLQTIPISDQIAASRGEMKRCNHKLFNALQTYD